jgi:formiminotetrahydrofolate cyclodeaminase
MIYGGFEYMFKEMSIKKFMDETSSDSPAPGGGSIAALNGASAAALIQMVANLTLDKKGYENVQKEMEEIKKTAQDYKEKFINYIDEDANSFNSIMAAFKLPKNTDEEKNERKNIIQESFKKAALVPLNVAKDAYQLFSLAEKVVLKGNKNAVTDGAVAALSARTAVISALYNVKINLGSIKDEKFTEAVRRDVCELESKVNDKEREILSKVNL